MVQKLRYSLILTHSLLFFSLVHAQGEAEDLIESVVLDKHSINITINKSFKEMWLRDDFFASYEKDINLQQMPYSIALLPFILNIYPVVWVSGKDYVIDCMDEDTYYSLERIKKIFQRLYPSTPFLGNLIPKTLVKNAPSTSLVNNETDIAVLYSSGLDSTACSFQYHDKRQLLITAQGQGDLPTRMDRLWNSHKKRFIKYAQDYGHTNAFVKCNYTEFLNFEVLEKVSEEIRAWRVDTTEGIGLFGAAAPILFAKGYSTLHIGSTFTWEYPWPTAANPLVDSNLTVASAFSLKHVHFDINRFEKVKLIVDLVRTKNIKIPFMRVCDAQIHGGNCCLNCAKCQTVINSFLVLNENPVPYGFKVTFEQIEERAKEYFTDTKGYWTCWNFCVMQEQLRELPWIPEEAEWLREFDFMSCAGYFLAGTKIRVNWENFRDLAPHTLEIPAISPCNCDNTKKKIIQERKRKAYAKKMLKRNRRRNLYRSIPMQELEATILSNRLQAAVQFETMKNTEPAACDTTCCVQKAQDSETESFDPQDIQTQDSKDQTLIEAL
ncbi:hypothetical protein H0W26_02100 [Candidatus Dependentiae bacterium]|nr:hypothetical protein [Candidatus Dependentiae bacterium]